MAADWQYAAGSTSTKQQRLITPSLSTTGCQKFYRVYTNHQNNIGDSALGLPNEPFRLYYRTSGISDNTGSWTLVNDNGDLSAITAASAIQFMMEFKAIGRTCLAQKIYNLAVIYEDDSTDSHFEPSINKSDTTNKIFAWRFSKAFGTTVPTLVVRIYDDVTDTIIAADTTSSPSAGTFQKSTNDGSSWSSYNSTDKTNDITYIRYTVTGTVNGVKARAVLQQYGNQTTGSGTPAGSLTRDITFGGNDTGDRMGLLLESAVGTLNAFNDIATNYNNFVEELKQMPVPIANRRKVR